jgi:hypothetical protein
MLFGSFTSDDRLITFPVIVDLQLLVRSLLSHRARVCGSSLNIHGARFTRAQALL